MRPTRYPLHGPPEQRYAPFFIVGAGRSGTTLLRRILQAAPAGVHIPPETYMLGKVARHFRRYQNLDWPEMVALVYATFEFHQDFHHFGVSLRPLAQQARKWRGPQRNLAALLDALFRYHAEQTGAACARWGDKTPFHSFFLPEILATFPDARMVHMLRDGADAVASYVKGGLRGDLEAAAASWRDSVQAVAAFEREYPAAVHTIRYEELVSAPHTVVPPLCEFLGLEYAPEMLTATEHAAGMGDVAALAHLHNVMNPISTASIGKGRRSLTPGQRAALEPIIGAELRRCGYESLLERPTP